MSNRILRFIAGLAFASFSVASHAGIPVLDASNLAQQVQQVVSWVKQYQQMADQYQRLGSQLNAVTGKRGLGQLMNNPALQQIVPADVASVLSLVNVKGFEGLTSSAKAHRQANAIYNCDDKTGELARLCQALLGAVSQETAYQQSALDLATQRVNQIQALQAAIDSTDDPKSIAELTARLQAENAQVTNDANRLAAMRSLAEAQRLAAEQAMRERSLRMLSANAPKSGNTFTYTAPAP